MKASGASSPIKKIGKYEIRRELAQGGFGRVFEAFDPVVGRPVAIKVLINESDPDTLKRFRLEATAAGNLNHPNIVTIYDFGEQDKLPYLVMEFLRGETLQEIIRSQTLTIIEKSKIMLQVAHGLECAHSHGVIHRDIKPANIMLLPDGAVKLMDFGIARGKSHEDNRLTQTGFLIGTLQYTAPELFQSAQADALTDIFAYGVVFYELVTGKHPFGSGDTASLVYQITCATPAPVRSISVDCPESLEQVIHRALEKDRNLRYQKLHEVRGDLEPALSEVQRERAECLIGGAEELLKEERWEEAHSLLREINDLDPANTKARRLRSVILQQQQLLGRKKRAHALSEEGMAALAARRFDEALTVLESAFNLDSENDDIRRKLESARAALEQRRNAIRLLEEAKRRLEQQDSAGASQIVAEVLRFDAGNTDAPKMLALIRDDAARRDAERKFEQHLARARSLLAAGEPEQSISILERLDRERPGASEVADLLAQCQMKKAAKDRRRRFELQLASARSLLPDKPASAVRELEQLRQDYPEESEVQGLLAHARAELRAQDDARRLANLKVKVRELMDRTQHDEALNHVEAGLRDFPRDSDLLGLFHEALSRKSAEEREQRIRQAQIRIEELRAQGDLSQAIKLVESTLNDLGRDTRLAALESQLRGEWEQRRKEKAAQDLIIKATDLIRQGRENSAVTLLRTARSEFPESVPLADLLAQAEKESARKDRLRTLEEIQHRVHSMRDGLDFAGALAETDRALQAFPNEPALTKLKKQLEQARNEQARDDRIREVLKRCEALRKRGLIDEAMRALEELPLAEMERTQAAELRKHAETEISLVRGLKQHADVELALAEAGQLERERRLPEALARLDDATVLYPADAQITHAIDRLKVRIGEEEKRDIERRIGSAQHFLSAGELGHALQEAQSGLVRHPESAELSQLAQRIQNSIREAERAGRANQAVKEIQKLIDEKRWEAAGTRAGNSQRELGADSRFESFLDLIRKNQAAEQEARRQHIKQVIDESKSLEQRGEFQAALNKLEDGKLYLGDQELEFAASRMRQRLRDFELREKLTGRIQSIESELKAERYSSALVLIDAAREDFPGEAALERLLARGREGKRSQEFAGLIRKAKVCLEESDLGGADKVVRSALQSFPGNPALEDLKKAIGDRRRMHTDLNHARTCLARRQLDKAEQSVRKTLAFKSDHPEALSLLDAIQAARIADAAQGPKTRAISSKMIVLCASIAVVIVALVFVLPRFFRSAPVAPPPVPVVRTVLPHLDSPEPSPPITNPTSPSAAVPDRKASKPVTPREDKPVAKPEPKATRPAPVVQPNTPMAIAPVPIAPNLPECVLEGSGLPYENGSTSGTLKWIAPNSGTSAKQMIHINQNKHTDVGTVSGDSFPRKRVKFMVSKGAAIIQSPTNCNGRELVIENRDGLTTLELNWEVY